jgi:hypothetical protein
LALILGFFLSAPFETKGAPGYAMPPERFLGSSLFMLANFIPMENPPRFFQVAYGFRPTPQDALVLEAITWRYNAPLGIPYGPSFEDTDEEFPGIVRDFGLGIAYQRFLYRRLFTALHATPIFHQFLDRQEKLIQNGFLLFVTARLGYGFQFFDNRLFVEPSIAVTHWPLNTNMPHGFREKEEKWPNYFLMEPGLDFGFGF